MDEVLGFLCFGGVVAVAATVVVLILWRRNSVLADELRDLRRRLVALELHRETREAPAPPPVAAAAPAPPPVAAAAPAPEVPRPAPPMWVETRPPAIDTPPPLPASPPPAPKPPDAPPLAKSAVTTRTAVQTAPAQPAMTFESFLGGRVMLIVGVVVGLLGIAFFLKYMIDQGLITRGGRIAMGVTAGLALLAGGERLRRRGFDLFGQALMGFGLGALYLSNYFACSVYDMIGPSAAFGLTAAITAAGAVLALSRGAPVLAYLGFLGGYLAPWLLSKSSGDLVGLTTWLLVLDAGLLVVLLRRAWNGLDLLALAATSVYFTAWFVRHADGADPGTAGACLASLAAASLALGLVPSIARRARPSGQSLFGVAGAGALAVIAGHGLLFPAHRVALGVAVAMLGAAYWLASGLTAKRVADARPESESLLAFAAAALATAVAVVFSGNAVSPALSIAGLAVVFAGTRTRHGALLACGIGTIALACCDLLLNRLGMFDTAATPFLNERFFVFACPFAALLVAGRLMSKAEGVTPATATLVAAAGLLLLPVVVAGDLFRGFAPVDDLHRELRYVAPAAALAVYGVLAARLFGRGSALGRAFAFVPVVCAVLFGVTLLFFGHVHPFELVLNPTFLAGILVVAAARFAAGAGDGEARARNWLGVVAAVFLLALVTAEIHAWGETCNVGMHGNRHDPQFAARNWIAIAWAAFASALALAEAVRRWKPLAWAGIGHVAAERTLASLVLAGALVWQIANQVQRGEVVTWGHGNTPGSPLDPFANLVFRGGLALVVAAHVVGRGPFDAARRVTRLAGLAWLLAVVTIELQWWGDYRVWDTRDPVTRPVAYLDVVAWTTIAWALFASAVAWMGAARKARALSWLGVDDDVLEGRVAVVPLLGAAIWGIVAMAGPRATGFTPALNLAFVAGLVVAASALAVAGRLTAVRPAAQIGALLWFLALFTAEIHHWGKTCPVGLGTRAEAEFRAVVWMSIAWAVYAAALVGVGFWKNRAAMRWVGLGVFALTVCKVFLVDLAQLEAVYRIGSFLVLGALLVAASFLYQRARRVTKPPSPPSGGATG